MAFQTEALIVGGGPAGLAAAIALRQRGVDCTVVEARSGGTLDKACGEGLMPDSRKVLADLGVPLTEADGHLFRGIRFTAPCATVAAEFHGGTGIGIRRPRLHALLADRAASLGARLLFGSHVRLQNSRRDASGCLTVEVDGAPVLCRWIVAADGQASTVRTWAGLDAVHRRPVRYGFRLPFRVAPWSDYVEVHWGAHGQLYVTPVAPDCVCAAYITRNPRPHQVD